MMAAPLLPALARGCHGCTYVFFFGEVSETVMKMVFARRSALGRVAEKMESVAAMEVVLFLLVRRESRQWRWRLTVARGDVVRCLDSLSRWWYGLLLLRVSMVAAFHNGGRDWFAVCDEDVSDERLLVHCRTSRCVVAMTSGGYRRERWRADGGCHGDGRRWWKLGLGFHFRRWWCGKIWVVNLVSGGLWHISAYGWPDLKGGDCHMA